MATCKLIILDNANCVFCGLKPEHVAYLYEEYSEFAPGYRFNPAFRLGSWDGKLRYFHKTGSTFVNLLPDIIPQVVGLKYKIDIDDKRPPALTVDVQPIGPDFFKHIINPETNEPWEFRDYQVEMVNTLIEAGGGVGVAGTGAGKALSLDAPVLTPSGWCRNGDLKPNDKIITPSNKIATIIDVFPQPTKELVRVTFHDGAYVDCCLEHLWQVKFPTVLHKASTSSRVVTTADIVTFLERKKSNKHTPGNISIPLVEPIELDQQDVTIDPYLMGVLLGDGCLQNHSTMISSADEHILDMVGDRICEFDIHVVHQQNYDYRLCKNTEQNSFPPSPNMLTEALKGYQLSGIKSHDKFVPSEYKVGSIAQRWDLVRGLMDTDGTADTKGNMSFTSTSKTLATDMQELVWSLGGTCTITTRIPTYTHQNEQKNDRLAYTCFIHHPFPKMLFTLPRKRDLVRNKHADGRVELTRRIVNITTIGQKPSQCISIDSDDKLYITKDYIVTHNTSMTAALALSYELSNNLRSIIIVPNKNLTQQTFEEYEFFGLDVGEYSGTVKDINHNHIVSTWQALQHNPTIVRDFDVIIVDECHGARGNVISELLNKHGVGIPFRFGVTGTLPKEPAELMAVRIALGDVLCEIPAHKLIAEGFLAKLHIDVMQLSMNLKDVYEDYLGDHTRARVPEKALTYTQFKNSYFPDWPAEKHFFQTETERLEWMADYITLKSAHGNVFCLTVGVAFGKRLAKLIPNAIYLYGKDPADERKAVYDLFKTNDNMIVIANAKIASTGLNIKRIFNMVLIDIGKSFITTIQGIGRGLRKASDKDSVHITDICSDAYHSKRHMQDRLRYYKEAKYPFTKRVIEYK